MRVSLSGLWVERRDLAEGEKADQMGKRRMAYWWFRLVLSGRFLARFLSLPRTKR